MSVEYQTLRQTAVTKLCIAVLSAVVYGTETTDIENTVLNEWVS